MVLLIELADGFLLTHDSSLFIQTKSIWHIADSVWFRA
jgi:hypothetical protein